jgi:hypothetical protein
MSAPSLFDVAAEQEALATGRPLSQTRLEIEHPETAPLPADSLFATVTGDETTGLYRTRPDAENAMRSAMVRTNRPDHRIEVRVMQACDRCGARFSARLRTPAECNLCRMAAAS